MNKSPLALLLLVVAFATSAEGDVPPRARCADESSDTGCRIAWEYVQSPSARYWIQSWNADDAKWDDVSPQPQEFAVAVTPATVPPGKLYRVEACAPERADCIASTVVWAPVWLSVEAIPARLPIKQPAGTTVDPRMPTHYAIAKNLSRSIQLAQYNMYLLSNELANIDTKQEALEMLPMSELTNRPTFRPPGTLQEMISFNVYDYYNEIKYVRSQWRAY